MKLCMSQYGHESMSDAEFEPGSFSGFGDMTSQIFNLKRGTIHKMDLKGNSGRKNVKLK